MIKKKTSESIFSIKYILSIIFAFLDLKSLARLCSINKSLNRHFKEDWAWKERIKNLNLIILNETDQNSLYELFQRYHINKKNIAEIKMYIKLNNHINLYIPSLFLKEKPKHQINFFNIEIMKGNQLFKTTIFFSEKFNFDEDWKDDKFDLQIQMNENQPTTGIIFKNSFQNKIYKLKFDEKLFRSQSKKDYNLLNEEIDQKRDKNLIIHDDHLLKKFNFNHLNENYLDLNIAFADSNNTEESVRKVILNCVSDHAKKLKKISDSEDYFEKKNFKSCW